MLITITPVNDTPVLAPIGNKTVKVGTLLTFTATATDVDAGQTKTFSLIGAPAGATINASTGVFNWTPSSTGIFTFKVRVTDNGVPLLYDEEQITVTVNTTGSPALTIESLEEENLLKRPMVYPNPVTSSFIVTFDPSYTKISATITDLKGSMVRNWSMNNVGAGKLQLDIGKLSAGQYVLRLNSGNKVWVFKLVKL